MQPLVIDLSHYIWDARVPDFAAVKDSGVIGVIYKATEGATYQDPKYEKTRDAALAAGLLWGAFHFATAAPPDAQVENFMKTVEPDAETLVALDFEHNDPHPGNTTDFEKGLTILQGLEQAIHRKPLLYTGSFMFDLFDHHSVPELEPYRLWWAQYPGAPYPADPTLHPTWTDYWLWQYTNGKYGPPQRQVPGIGGCDCNYFRGDAALLTAQWAT